MENLNVYIKKILHDSTYLCVISSPRKKDEELCKIEIHLLNGAYLVEKYTNTQVFHSHLSHEETIQYLAECLHTSYRYMHAWDGNYEYRIQVSKKGKVFFSRNLIFVTAPKPRTAHNYEKASLLPKDVFIAPLYDMGVYTKEGKIVSGMYDKFRQINRFIEIIDDTLRQYDNDELNILDFGCGKSYLTFVLYYYLTQVRGLHVHMIGLDLKKDVIDKCNTTAIKYGYDTLSFQVGDIAHYHYETPLDMVITLHACDTATDYALFNAIRWKAKMIFSVPCCQHELNSQIQQSHLSILSRYGLVKEQFCALATDAIRANLLECCGYRTQLLEFIDSSHTPKNTMIRAIYTGTIKNKAFLQEVEALIGQFKFHPTLYHLLLGEKLLKS